MKPQTDYNAVRRRLVKRYRTWVGSSEPDHLLTKQTIKSSLEALDSPRALAVWLLYKHGEHRQLVDLPQPCERWGSTEYQASYVATELLTKAKFLNFTEDDRVTAATEKYWAAERACALTNRRLISVDRDPLFEGEMARIIHRAWYWINKVVGEGPSVEDFFSGANWGPGVTQCLKGKDATGYDKYQKERSATERLWRFVGPQWKHQYPNWGIGDCEYSNAIDVMFVPKNAKTHRVIGVEPGLNVWFQKSLGTWLRRRLRTFGVDLDRGQELHNRLALAASLNGEAVTVDFSSASDHIAQECVRLLFSGSSGAIRTLKLLELCRTPLAKLDGKLFALEKFSSMGNGFTFELQTLIFWSLARAVGDFASVYGDDVIIPKTSYPAFSAACGFLGLKINESKTCIEGYFRESCGGHYYCGTDCKPYYFRELITNATKYKIANGVRLLAARLNCLGSRARMRKTWYRLYKSVPAALRFSQPLNRASFEPSSYTDGAFILDWNEVPEASREYIRKAPFGVEGFETLVATTVALSKQATGEGLKHLRIRQIGQPNTTMARNSVPLRSQVTRSINVLLVASWDDIGPF